MIIGGIDLIHLHSFLTIITMPDGTLSLSDYTIRNVKEMTMMTVKIKGMSCQHCVASVTKALTALEGISNVKVDLQKGTATFNGTADRKTLQQAIEKIGFELID